ncbi:MAG: DUF523 domain-containing protein, partial [Clostridia bacterium]|nr:DUF523 domain-containing protein [Clostridia bacterium]
KSGEDVTQAFNQGAKEVLKLVEFYDCKKALLKQKSPSCGSGKIYDGNFKRVIIKGNGVLTDLLLENGVQVYGEEELQNLL